MFEGVVVEVNSCDSIHAFLAPQESIRNDLEHSDSNTLLCLASILSARLMAKKAANVATYISTPL